MTHKDITAAAALIIGFLLGFFCGWYPTSNHYKKQAIENNCAEYNLTTGEFQWKIQIKE